VEEVDADLSSYFDLIRTASSATGGFIGRHGNR